MAVSQQSLSQWRDWRLDIGFDLRIQHRNAHPTDRRVQHRQQHQRPCRKRRPARPGSNTGTDSEDVRRAAHSLNRPNSTDLQRLAVDPQLIGPDGRANPAFLIPNRTPGEFGQLLFLRDKNTFQWDVSVTKSFQILEKAGLEIFAGFNNVLNHPRWAITAIAGNPRHSARRAERLQHDVRRCGRSGQEPLHKPARHAKLLVNPFQGRGSIYSGRDRFSKSKHAGIVQYRTCKQAVA